LHKLPAVERFARTMDEHFEQFALQASQSDPLLPTPGLTTLKIEIQLAKQE
jgi:hypothetical protein